MRCRSSPITATSSSRTIASTRDRALATRVGTRRATAAAVPPAIRRDRPPHVPAAQRSRPRIGARRSPRRSSRPLGVAARARHDDHGCRRRAPQRRLRALAVVRPAGGIARTIDQTAGSSRVSSRRLRLRRRASSCARLRSARPDRSSGPPTCSRAAARRLRTAASSVSVSGSSKTNRSGNRRLHPQSGASGRVPRPVLPRQREALASAQLRRGHDLHVRQKAIGDLERFGGVAVVQVAHVRLLDLGHAAYGWLRRRRGPHLRGLVTRLLGLTLPDSTQS